MLQTTRCTTTAKRRWSEANYQLRGNRACDIHPRAYSTPKMSLNQWRKKQDPAKLGWWNHDTHEVSDSGTVVQTTHYKRTFEAGDLFTLTAAMRHGAKIMRSYLDADNSATDWMAATEHYEYSRSQATRAYEDALIAKSAAARAAKASTPSPRSEHDILLERVTTTGSSGLGKAKRKVSR